MTTNLETKQQDRLEKKIEKDLLLVDHSTDVQFTADVLNDYLKQNFSVEMNSMDESKTTVESVLGRVEELKNQELTLETASPYRSKLAEYEKTLNGWLNEIGKGIDGIWATIDYGRVDKKKIREFVDKFGSWAETAKEIESWLQAMEDDIQSRIRDQELQKKIDEAEEKRKIREKELEEEKGKLEEEKRKLEEEKGKLEEEKRKLEEENRKLEGEMREREKREREMREREKEFGDKNRLDEPVDTPRNIIWGGSIENVDEGAFEEVRILIEENKKLEKDIKLLTNKLNNINTSLKDKMSIREEIDTKRERQADIAKRLDQIVNPSWREYKIF